MNCQDLYGTILRGTTRFSGASGAQSGLIESRPVNIERLFTHWQSLFLRRTLGGGERTLCRLGELPAPSGSPFVVRCPTSIDHSSHSREPRSVADLIATVKAAFGLSISQLAQVLRVQRPTVYAWLDEDQGSTALRSTNRERLAQLVDLAECWNAVSRRPARELLDAWFIEGKTLLDWLASEPLDVAWIKERLPVIARDVRRRREEAKPTLAERLKAKGYSEVPRERRGLDAL